MIRIDSQDPHANPLKAICDACNRPISDHASAVFFWHHLPEVRWVAFPIDGELVLAHKGGCFAALSERCIDTEGGPGIISEDLHLLPLRLAEAVGLDLPGYLAIQQDPPVDCLPDGDEEPMAADDGNLHADAGIDVFTDSE